MVSSSLARKFVMAGTGIFLILFLIVHVTGNLLLLKNDGGVAFNQYAHFMKHNPLILAGEVVLFAGILWHVVQGIILMVKNRAARPVDYAYKNTSERKSFFSKYMGQMGILILILLIWHLYNFFSYKYFAELRGGIDMVEIEGEKVADMASIVYEELSIIGNVIIYLVFVALIAFHLHHGFQSAFQSLGLNHRKYTPIIKKIGVAYSIIIPLLFAVIPVLIFLGFAGGQSAN